MNSQKTEFPAKDNKVAEAIMSQTEKLDQEYDDLKRNLEKKEMLIADMLDYLAENKSIDLKSHFSEEQFLPALCVENRCLQLPPPNDPVPCPLVLEALYAAETLPEETRIVLKLFNSSGSVVKNVSCAVLRKGASEKYLYTTRSCLFAMPQKHGSGNFRPNLRSLKIGDNQPFYVNQLRPKEFGYLIISFDVSCEKELIDLALRCCVCNKELKCEDPLTNFQRLAFSSDWSQWCGTIATDFCIDPWFSDKSPMPELLPLIICSRTAFLPCWTVEITAQKAVTDQSDTLGLIKLADDVFISDSALLPLFTIIRHTYCGVGDRKFVYSLFCTENIADKFFRRILDLKLCTNIEDYEATPADDDLACGKAPSNISSRLKNIILKNIEILVSKPNGEVNGGYYRKIKADLALAELCYT